MRSTNICPKCNCNDIAAIGGGVFKGNIYNTISVGLSTIYMTRYVCLSCGFTENYVEDPDDLQKIARKYRIEYHGGQDYV